MKQYLLALMMLASVSGWAGDKDSAYTANSAYTAIGARSCGTYIEHRKAGDWEETVVAGWVDGYLTAYNA